MHQKLDTHINILYHKFFKRKAEFIIWLSLINNSKGFLLQVTRASCISQALSLPVCKFLNFFIYKTKLINFHNIHYLAQINKFPYNFLTFFNLFFKLFIFFSPSINFASLLFKSFQDFSFY